MDECRDKCQASLESTYHHYRQLFEDRSRMSWQEEGRIRSPGLQNTVKKLYSDFWKYVDTITTDYFKIIKMLNMKKDVEKSVMDIWTQYVSPLNEKPPMVYHLDFENTEDLPSTERSPKSQMLTGVVQWYKSRVVRYKTASEFAGELRMAVVKTLQDAEISPLKYGMSPTPILYSLKDRAKWFACQVEDLEETIAQLDMSRHSIRMGLFSTGPANNRVELAVKKTKRKNRKPKKLDKILVI